MSAKAKPCGWCAGKRMELIEEPCMCGCGVDDSYYRVCRSCGGTGVVEAPPSPAAPMDLACGCAVAFGMHFGRCADHQQDAAPRMGIVK